MNFYYITPTAYLRRFAALGDGYLALAHLIEYETHNGVLSSLNEYGRFHLQQSRLGRKVILDNGLFEGAQVEAEDLLCKAKIIGADTVCAPDVLYNSKATIKAFKNFIKLKQDMGMVIKVMGIPQADNPGDWWECFQFMDHNKDCDLIGLSILSIPKSFQDHSMRFNAVDIRQPISHSRKHVLEQLYDLSILTSKRLTPMHMLGLGESYDDIKTALNLLPRDVVSNDSSSCFVSGMHGVVYEEDGTIPGGKIKEKLDFSIKDLRRDQEDLILRNIEITKRINQNEHSRRSK